MGFRETTEYLFSRYPMFERGDAQSYKPGLESISRLCAALDHPQNAFKSIHIAGTNGKGSAASMLNALLMDHYPAVGLFTSPHLHHFCERMRINGIPISEDWVVTWVESNKVLLEEISPSFFEITTAMAFCAFRDFHVSVAVIEVGLGGRLDATNIIQPELSLITRIGLDHMQYLGTDKVSIAREKAGIIKRKVPVVAGPNTEEVYAVFRQQAKAMESSIFIAEDRWSAEMEEASFAIKFLQEPYFKLSLDLGGAYQTENVCSVLETWFRWCEMHNLPFEKEKIKDTLRIAGKRSGLKGRWQKLSDKPLIIADAAHNADGFAWAMKQAMQTKHQRLWLILGFSNDKEISEMLASIPKEAKVIATQAASKRALEVGWLYNQLADNGYLCVQAADVNAALALAKSEAEADDLILIAGSLYLLGELNALLNG
jgi:dihydrofolate synthase/folylpolyglutamate synthase